MDGPVEQAAAAGRAFLDLHCHTSASFDSLASPASMVETAARRGLTHLVITDHDTIDGALEAQARAPRGLAVIVGQEIRTAGGDMTAAFLTRAVPAGLSPREAVAAVREQGGLVGMAHPFDRLRGSVGLSEGGRSGRAALIELASEVDWIEVWNARLLFGDGNARASALAREVGVPGVAVSDAHTTLEVGVALTIVTVTAGDPATPEGLRAALAAGPELLTGHASAYVRLITPVAKFVQGFRGRGRTSVPR